MKKILNSPDGLVREMCEGMALAHPELELLAKYKIIKRARTNPDKVALISGGGSGHEPAHAGFVGRGMLDAAVCGDVFASPSQIQVYQAIRTVAGGRGALLIIKNYSGDMMNFQNAAFLAREDGVEVEYVRVCDDIAVQDSLYTVGRRGVAGTVFVHKIAGAMAERGGSLAQVKAAAEKAAQNVRSIGFALTSCTVPAKGMPTFALGEDEMEYGVGIHGEPVIRREKLAPAGELARRMAEALLEELPLTGKHPEAAVLVNGFGGTPLQELYAFHYAVMRVLSERNIAVVKALVGNYMTSLDMAGTSLSLLALDDELKALLLDPCDTPALKLTGSEPAMQLQYRPEPKADHAVCYATQTHPSWARIVGNRLTLQNVVFLMDKLSECVTENEVHFCEMDSHTGDGDFGMSIAKGFRQLKAEWDELLKNNAGIGGFLEACSLVIMEHCGGASGPIWGAAFGRRAGARPGKLR